MIHRTSVERSVPTSDGGGGYTETWTPLAVGIPCRAWYIGSQEPVHSDRPGVVDMRAVLVPSDTDVREGDRLPSVLNRKGETLFDGPLVVDAVGERLNDGKIDCLRLTTRRIQ